MPPKRLWREWEFDMPYKMEKKDGYKVSSPHGVHAKHTTKAKAEAQMNLLRGIEHGWKPTGALARRARVLRRRRKK